MTFDQGQTPRLGQTLPPEQPGIQVVETVTLPEVAFPGQVVYLTDTSQFAVFWNGAWQSPNTGPDPVQTFVSATTPTADHVGDLWLNTTTFQLSVWNGTAWVIAIDPENTLKKYQAVQTVQTLIGAVRSTPFIVYISTSAPVSPVFNDYWYNPQTNVVQRRSSTAWGSDTTANLNAIRNWAATSSIAVDGQVRYYIQNVAPSGLVGSDEGDIWYSTPTATTYRWNGGAWVTLADGLAMGSGAIGDDQVSTSQLRADAITAKHTLTGPTIQTTATASRGIKMTSASFVVYNSAGAATFTIDAATGAVTMLGTLTSGSQITGATIVGGQLSTANSPNARVQIAPSTLGGHESGEVAFYGAGNVLNGLVTGGSGNIYLVGTTGATIAAPSIFLQVNTGATVTTNGKLVAGAGGLESLAAATLHGVVNAEQGVIVGFGAVQITTGGHVIANGNLTAGNNVTAPNVITGGGYVRTIDTGWTTTTASNVRVELPGNGGRFLRVTSDRGSKLNITDIALERAKKILDVPARTWVDKRYAEIAADYLDRKNKGEKDLEEPFYDLNRVPGVVADELEAAGLPELVTRDSEDPESLASVAYDRMASYLIPIIKDQQDRIEKLEKRLATLEKTKAAGTK